MQDIPFNKIVIGSGLIAENLLYALIKHKGELPSDFLVIGKQFDRCAELRGRFNIKAQTDPQDFIKHAKVLVIAADVEDLDDIPTIAAEIRDALPPNILINSLSPHLTIEILENLFPGRPVMRLLINISAICGRGIGAFCCGNVNHSDTETLARFLLESFGEVIETDSEEEFEKVARFIQAQTWWCYLNMHHLIKAGVDRGGIAPDKALKIVTAVSKGVASTFVRMNQEELITHALDYKFTVQESFDAIEDYGLVDDIVKATGMNFEEIKANFINNSFISEVKEEKFKFHYKSWE